jgi:hypothetical protein
VSILPWKSTAVPAVVLRSMTLPALLAIVFAIPDCCLAQDDKPAPKAEAPAAQPGAPTADPADLVKPPKIEEVALVPNLHTVPVPRDRPGFSFQMVNASLLPRDKDGIWVLDFKFKPLRIRTVDLPGKGRRNIVYMYYQVVNRTGAPRMFVPQFIKVNEDGKKFEDEVIPEAIPLIQSREDPTIPILGAVNIMGVIPPSTKPDVDDAVFGAAVWDKWDLKSDRFSIYVRGLSDGYKEVPNPSGGKPIVKYKTLRIDYLRRGDEHNLSEKEFQLNDPPYEWVYW